MKSYLLFKNPDTLEEGNLAKNEASPSSRPVSVVAGRTRSHSIMDNSASMTGAGETAAMPAIDTVEEREDKYELNDPTQMHIENETDGSQTKETESQMQDTEEKKDNDTEKSEANNEEDKGDQEVKKVEEVDSAAADKEAENSDKKSQDSGHGTDANTDEGVQKENSLELSDTSDITLPDNSTTVNTSESNLTEERPVSAKPSPLPSTSRVAENPKERKKGKSDKRK